MSFTFIFYLLLNIAHFVYSLSCFFIKKFKLFLSSIKQYEFFNKIPINKFETAASLIETSKLPRHLAVLLGHEKISICDLVKLISWCVSAQIPYVSFYDYKGNLLKNKENLKDKFDELESIEVQNVEWINFLNHLSDPSSTFTDKIKPNNGLNKKLMNHEATNLNKKSKTKVQVLSYSDGKDKIINLTKSLAHFINLKLLQMEDITPQLLDEKLTLSGKLPDPDLAIICGDTMCTYGFLPWQSRITQFFILPSHHNLSATIFHETLIKYSKCQQRYGK